MNGANSIQGASIKLEVFFFWVYKKLLFLRITKGADHANRNTRLVKYLMCQSLKKDYQVEKYKNNKNEIVKRLLYSKQVKSTITVVLFSIYVRKMSCTQKHFKMQ